jgi:hypothetical protein
MSEGMFSSLIPVDCIRFALPAFYHTLSSLARRVVLGLTEGILEHK